MKVLLEIRNQKELGQLGNFHKKLSYTLYKYFVEFISRCLIAVWIYYALLLTAGYGGNLRAFLLQPMYEDSIDDMQDMINSQIPWEIGLSGENVEVQMAESNHPLMKKVWDEKIEVWYEAIALDAVSI